MGIFSKPQNKNSNNYFEAYKNALISMGIEDEKLEYILSNNNKKTLKPFYILIFIVLFMVIVFPISVLVVIFVSDKVINPTMLDIYKDTPFLLHEAGSLSDLFFFITIWFFAFVLYHKLETLFRNHAHKSAVYCFHVLAQQTANSSLDSLSKWLCKLKIKRIRAQIDDTFHKLPPEKAITYMYEKQGRWAIKWFLTFMILTIVALQYDVLNYSIITKDGLYKKNKITNEQTFTGWDRVNVMTSCYKKNKDENLNYKYLIKFGNGDYYDIFRMNTVQTKTKIEYIKEIDTILRDTEKKLGRKIFKREIIDGLPQFSPDCAELLKERHPKDYKDLIQILHVEDK